MSAEIDARGLACPAPVLMTKKKIDAESPALIQIWVDNEAAKQNVTRFLESRHYNVSMDPEGAHFQITGRRDENETVQKTPAAAPGVEEKKIMVMVTTDRIGHGDDELGSKLMVSFLTTLKEMGNELWRLVLLNNGVKLAIENSSVLTSLKDLEDTGVSIMVCGTCLHHFKMLEKKQVGVTTNMLDIVTAMQLADKVINM